MQRANRAINLEYKVLKTQSYMVYMNHFKL